MNQRRLSHHSSVGNRPDRLSRPALAAGRTGHAEEPSGTQTGGFSSILRKYPLTLAVTALAALVFSTVAAFVVYRNPDPTSWILPGSCVVLALSSLIGGMTAGWQNPTHSVAAAFFCGGCTTVLLTLLSLLFPGHSGIIPWVMRLGAVLLHILGGVITRPKPKSPTHTAGNHPSRG